MIEINIHDRRTLIETLPKEWNYALEIGVSSGWFSHYILSNTNLHLYCLDPWEFNPQLTQNWNEGFEHTKKLLSQFPDDRYTLIRGWSPKETEQFPDEYFDFVYIDGGHTYEDVIADLKGVWPKVKSGGIIAGHDWGWPGVQTAVNEFIQIHSEFIPDIGITGVVNYPELADVPDEFLEEVYALIQGECDGRQQSWVLTKFINK